MKTTYDQYAQYEYLTNEKESMELSLIQSAKESIQSNIEGFELESSEDIDQEKLTKLKAIDIHAIEITDVESICCDDSSIRETLESLSTLESEITELEDKIDEVNSVLTRLPKSTNIDCSRKSESTYITYPIEMLNDFIKEFESIIAFNYYEDFTLEEFNELNTFIVRVACHEVGSKFCEYSNESVSYSDKCIFIKA